jgi:hypothetical protein
MKVVPHHAPYHAHYHARKILFSNVLSRFQRNIKAAIGKEGLTNAMGTGNDRIEGLWNQ